MTDNTAADTQTRMEAAMKEHPDADAVLAMWDKFARGAVRAITLWEDEGNSDWPFPLFRRKYMRQLLQDTAGFGAAEMMRRLIGLAHAHDLWTISNDNIRAAAESLALNIAQAWLMNRHTVTAIDDLVDMMVEARPSCP